MSMSGALTQPPSAGLASGQAKGFMGTVEIIPSAENDHRARQQGRFASVLPAERWWPSQGHGVAISMTRRTASLDHEPGLFIHP